MSRTACRARKRLQRLREAFLAAREADNRARKSKCATPGPGAIEQLLRGLERSGRCVWDVARTVRLTKAERMMVAQIVAPHLAGLTPGTVFLREKRAKE